MSTQASNTTNHYALSQWASGDHVRREDFNADNLLIDAALHDHDQSIQALDDHAADQTNPHAVTAAQAGAFATGDVIPIANGGTGQRTAAAAAAALLGTLTTGTPDAADLVSFTDVSAGSQKCATITALAATMGLCHIATGTYTGTGTYDADNAMSIDAGFVPKLIIVVPAAYNSSTPYANETFLIGLPGLSERYLYAGYYKAGSAAAKYLTPQVLASNFLSLNGNVVSWYSSLSTYGVFLQMNISGNAYAYFILG